MQTIGVKLQFTADTTAARKSMQDLQSQLTKLSQMNASTAPGVQMSKDLAQASVEAEKLKVSLQAAFNTNTGRLDLGKFRQALAQSGTSLKQVQATLTSLGPAGQQAFSSLATKIIAAEQPALRLNATMKKFVTTLASTARYQISTRMFQAVISSASDALSYVKDLNASLNDIRIVTGLSATAMDKFADRATKAAKALSTTTNELTKASLIYFQQGLGEDEAMARAETTMKMANVTGQAAEKVSDQLTAIWNNFYDGSESLEYYADVITALGAATASSTDEIAQGLEKFAAVAETVGLSYEYATAALATVTSETRQSADVVGTAFKTLFARLQDLELGETLDDGTDLGSYSQALLAVGVDIKQANGELKAMDTILNEMGVKWKTLSSDQQVALAQNVAGVRQYTQLIALMDNWDTFQINLEVAENAEGTLQGQQDIYAESWEAASKRVSASVEEIYNKLLDDDFFISLTEGLAGFVDTISTVIDSLGGLKGVLLLIGNIFMNIFQDKVAKALSSAGAGISNFGQKALKVATLGQYQPKDKNAAMQQEAVRGLSQMYGDTTMGKSQVQATQNLINVNQNLLKYKNQLTEAEKLAYEMAVDRLNIEHNNVQQAAEEAKLRKQMLDRQAGGMRNQFAPSGNAAIFDAYAQQAYQVGTHEGLQTNVLNQDLLGAAMQKLGPNFDMSAATTQIDDMLARLQGLDVSADEVGDSAKQMFGQGTAEGLKSYAAELNRMKSVLASVSKAQDKMQQLQKKKDSGQITDEESKQLDALQNSFKEGGRAQTMYTEAQKKVQAAVKDTQTAMDTTNTAYQTNGEILRTINPNIDEFGNQMQDSGAQTMQTGEQMHQFGQKARGVGDSLDGTAKKTVDFSQRIAAFGSTVMQLGSLLSSVSGLVDTFTNPDTSTWERFISILTTAGIVIMTATTIMNKNNIAKLFGLELTKGQTLGEVALEKAKGKGIVALIIEKATQNAVNKEKAAGIALTRIYIGLLGVLVGLILLIARNNKSSTKAQHENAKAALELAEANREVIDSAQELTDSLQDLIKTYQDLRDSSKSTYDTMQEIKEAFPDLIKAYDELGRKLGVELDLAGLEQAYKELQQSGDISKLEQRIAEIEKQIGKTSFENATDQAEAAKTVALTLDGAAVDRHYTTTAMIDGVQQKVGAIDFDVASYTERKAQPGSLESLTFSQSALDKMTSGQIDFENDQGTDYTLDKEAFTVSHDGGFKFKSKDSHIASIGRYNPIELAGITALSIPDLEPFILSFKDEGFQLRKPISDAEFLQFSSGLNTYISRLSDIFSSTQLANDGDLKDLMNYLRKLQTETNTAVEKIREKQNQAKNLAASGDMFAETDSSINLGSFGIETKTVDTTQSTETNDDTGSDGHSGHGGGKGTRNAFVTPTGGAVSEAVGSGTDDTVESIPPETQESIPLETQEALLAQYDVAELYKTLTNAGYTDEDMSLIAEALNNPYKAWEYRRANLIEQIKQSGLAATDDEAAELLAVDPTYGAQESAYQFLNSEKFAKNVAAGAHKEVKQWYSSLSADDQAYAYTVLAEGNFASRADVEKAFNDYLSKTRAHRADQDLENLATEEELDLELMYKQAENLENQAGLARDVALELSGVLFRTQKGMDALTDDWEEWSELLAETGNVLTPEQTTALRGLQEAFEDIFGLTDIEESLGDKFFLNDQVQELITTIAEGGEEAEQALADLSKMAAQQIIFGSLDTTDFNDDQNKLLSAIQAVDNTNIEIGATLNASDAMKELAKFMIAQGKTVAQIQETFNTLGWYPKMKKVKIKTDSIVDKEGYITTENGQLYVGGAGTKISAEQEVLVFEGTEGIGNLAEQDLGSTITATYAPKHNTLPLPSSKGGGGKSDKELKVLDEEIERYHQISELLDDLNRQYDELSERKDRAFGASHFGYLEAEKEQLDEIIQAQKDYVSEIEGYLATDKEALLQYGATLDEEGRITNYEELMRVNVESYNKAAEKFNAGQMSEEQFAEYEKAYEKFLKDMEQYEETLNLLEDEQQTLFEKQNERFDKSLEKAEYIVELGTGLIEDSLEIIEYQLNKIDDEAYEAAEAMSLIGQKMAETMKKQDIYKQAIAETLGASGLTIDDILNLDSTQLQELVNNGTFTAEQVEQLRDYRNGLLELNEEMNDLADEGIETVISAFDAWDEKFDETTEKFEHLSNTVQSYRDIIDLVGKDTLNVSDDMLDTLNQMTVSMSQNSLKTAKAQLEANKSNLQKAREELMQATNETERKRWQQIIDDLEVRVREGEETVLSSWQDALQATTDAFEDALERIGQAFEDAAAGIYESLDALQSAYDQRTQISERYVADYTKIYELSKLTRDITKSMDESDSIRAKSKLRDLQEEIYALQASGAEMTEYEVNELRARYELRLAEIALEEAQSAKSQVRMSRDSEGNWSYVYTADEEATATAAQAYEDQLYKYQQLTQDYTKKLQDQLLALPATAKEAITELMQNTALTEEQKEARKAELVEFYTSQYNYILSELERANADSRNFYETDWLQYSEISGYKISVNEKWIDSFNETVYAELTGFSTLEEAQSAFTSSLQTFSENASSVFTKWHNNVAAIMQLAGSSVETFADTLSASIAQVYQDSKTYQQEIEDIIKDMDENTEGLFIKAEEIWKKYAEHVNNGATANEQLAQSINNVIGAIAVATGPLDTLKNKYWAIQKAAEAAAVQIAIVNGNGGSSFLPNASSYKVNYEDLQTDHLGMRSFVINKANLDTVGWYINGLDGKHYFVRQDKFLGEVAMPVSAETILDLQNFGVKQWNPDSNKPLGFDTGGYTGSWDASGRLAMLHQKEIVLNAHDTENFLSAVNIVRDIAKVIDLNASAQSGLFSLISSMTVAPSTQTIEQEVTIHAEFPNATNHSEIEEAFNTLINRASQFANRKN